MNAIVDVYLDNNLGDNIMGEMLINFLQKNDIKCYLLINNEFTYSNFIDKFSDVDIINNIDKEVIKEKAIDFYIRVGGSIFPHNTAADGIFRYHTLLQYKMMKQNGVKIFILGCNVGPFKSSIGIGATKGIIKTSNLITCRDKKTYDFISKIKKKDFFIFPDIVFSRKDLRKKNKKENDVLGISTYTGYTKELIKYNYDYTKMMCGIVNKYLLEKRNGKVKLFVFDSGYNSDYPTSHRIYDSVKDKKRIEIIDFSGNIYDFMDEFYKCSVMIGTRFHSIVLALLCNTPILPVIYSNKTRNLLSDLNYQGEIIKIQNCRDVNINRVTNSIINGIGLLDSIDNKILEDSEGHLNILYRYIIKNVETVDKK
ncbi:polysaccharide pyruvyl transferase family protein [Falsibacillus albus]|uniref:polysaccharide pyruvyl transferase family protein n=1 Tax=Falsibacillus albus TaxID=2478915 RepID=UPI001314D994|nr:polysaccharide pyruvyl transferase family protein [Falsibacillus albus]